MALDQTLRGVLHRLTPDGRRRFCEAIGIEPPEADDLGPRQLTRAFEARLTKGENRAPLHKAEALAGELDRLTSVPDLGETALADVADGREDLIAILSQAAPLEDRALAFLSKDEGIYRRACNLALSMGYQDGRYHRRYRTQPDSLDPGRLQLAAERIREVVQGRMTGRRVHSDLFELRADEGGQPRQHLAVYIERGARSGLEIDDMTNDLVARLYKPANDLGITFDPDTGLLDVAGKGLGGGGVFDEVARVFGAEALNATVPQRVEREDWPLNVFRAMDPELPPPPGFSSVTVREIEFRNASDRSRKASFSGSESAAAYERMRQLGIGQAALDIELVGRVTLDFTGIAEECDTDPDIVKVVLSWPNGLTVTNASRVQREAIEDWLRRGAFASWALERA